MIKHKYIDCFVIICVVIACFFTFALMSKGHLGITPMHTNPPYASRLFDQSFVHEINIDLENREEFFHQASKEEYVMCGLDIDGERFEGVGIRVKGNNSLSLIERYDLQRYSLKIEFDHYDDNLHYYGLDKLSLDSSFQDNAYLKNYMTFDMMNFMGVPSPLCSYVWVTINHQPWGLFLAIEEPEEAFAKRCFGQNHGQLYKPGYKDLYDENADLALQYIGDDPAFYSNIFDNAKFDITKKDKMRLIEALKTLNSDENLESAVNIDEVIRYFVVQVFVVNLDSYLGQTGHNYFLYEKDGVISMLPWDYNLAYGTYSLGMPDPTNDTTLYINYPIDTPNSGEIMLNRPLFHQVMLHDEYFELYHDYFDKFISEYFESGYFEEKIKEVTEMIDPYIQKDPTAFCLYEEHLVGVETFQEFCLLRSKSIRGQLQGTIPSTIKQQQTDHRRIQGSHIALEDMGEISDLYN